MYACLKSYCHLIVYCIRKKMWRYIACIACCFGVAELTMPSGRHWRHKESGFAADGGYSYKGQVRGSVDCSRVCSRLDSTKSYFYYDDTRECQCHDVRFTGGEGSLQMAPNVRYYEEDIEAIELTDMTQPPCPVDASVATDVIRSGSSLFRVRAFLDTERSYDDAQAVCVSNGGILYKANIIEKFQLAHRLMTECPAYMSYTNYFVNGKYNDVTMKYETSDEEFIPTTQDFWAPGMPNGSGIKCLWMSAVFDGYRWDDRNCDILSGYPTFAFCEIPQ